MDSQRENFYPNSASKIVKKVAKEIGFAGVERNKIMLPGDFVFSVYAFIRNNAASYVILSREHNGLSNLKFFGSHRIYHHQTVIGIKTAYSTDNET
jgi:hypothetical protein